jgi:signal transduction histidine kinase
MPEHQALEADLFQRIRRGLDHLGQEMERAGTTALPADPQLLDEAFRCAQVLDRENAAEMRRAHEDVDRRANAAVWIMVLTVVFSLLALSGSLWFVFAQVVRPVLALRDGAERFGRGELGHRVRSRARDELGELARSFDRMADRVGETHEALEERIKHRTRQLVRTGRLADLGTLAAGVAHEINNPLASIASCAEGLQRRLQRREVPVAEQLEYVETIAREAYRAHEITARLLAFARQDVGPVGPVDVAPVARDLLLLLRHQFEQRGLRLVMTLPESLPAVQANANELKQALLNLLANARDASPHGGVVELRGLRQGDEICLEIRDQGSGIPEELMDRIFDPFFTTKPAGKGTGLGLAVACAIVEGFGGSLDAENLPTGGACFRITLPLAGETAT